MKKYYCLFAFGAFCGVSIGIPSAPRVGSESAEPKFSNLSIAIRVLLERATPHAIITSSRGIFLRRNENAAWEPLGNSVRIHVSPVGTVLHLHVDGVPLKTRYVHLRSTSSENSLLHYRNEKFRGVLRFTMRGNSLTVTNILPIEEYLFGTLPKEMSPSWELEALKAQAVASRTYALYMSKHPRHALYDLERNVQDQVYAGVLPEVEKLTKAVRETERQYLGLMGIREPIKAHFHSRCGGITETSKSVWRNPNPAFRQRVNCPYCQKNRYLWRASLGFDELTRRLGFPEMTPKPSIKKVQRSPSGRIAALTLESGGNELTVTSDEFRSLMGYSRIKSALFDWKIREQAFEFHGTGSGHGVGMCQWGARHLARIGKTYQEILAHYYPETILYQLAR